MIYILFVFLAAFLILGVPIAISLGLSSIIYFMLFTDIPILVLAQRLYANLFHFPLMAVPFFILAGQIAQRGGVARQLINFTNHLVGALPGGLGLASILACMIFASISGSSTATVAAIGTIMIPAMIREGYGKPFAIGTMTTAGTLGILIPPSIPLIIYGFIAEQSVRKLFVAGVLPGIVLGGSMMVVSYIIARLKGFRAPRSYSWREKWNAFRGAFWSLSLPVLILGGIYGVPEFSIGPLHIDGGAIFTPTEAAAVAVVYSFLISWLVLKEITLRDVPTILAEASGMTAMLLFIVTNAVLFGFLLTNEAIPLKLAEWIVSQQFPQWAFLLVVNIILFFAGDFMDPLPIITIFTPILFPVAEQLGVDPIHFGIIIVVNMEMGLITPPVGMNLYISSGITGEPLYNVLRYSAPWILLVVAVLLIVTYVPWLSLFLPSLLR